MIMYVRNVMTLVVLSLWVDNYELISNCLTTSLIVSCVGIRIFAWFIATLYCTPTSSFIMHSCQLIQKSSLAYLDSSVPQQRYFWSSSRPNFVLGIFYVQYYAFSRGKMSLPNITSI